jgi:hypothetical protein
MSAIGPKPTSLFALRMSAFDIGTATELLGSAALTIDLHQSLCASPNRK